MLSQASNDCTEKVYEMKGEKNNRPKQVNAGNDFVKHDGAIMATGEDPISYGIFNHDENSAAITINVKKISSSNENFHC